MISGALRRAAHDGFNESAAWSGVFTSVGRAPAVRIVSPASSERVLGDASLNLTGTAVDDRLRRITDSALAWYDGARLLGKGGSLSVTGLQPGWHTIRLVSRDRFGRTSARAVRVRVLAVAPRFLRVEAPTTLSRRARRVGIRVSSTIPARLRAGRQTFALDRTLRRIVLEVRPGPKALTLLLRLSAHGRQTSASVTIHRR